MTVVSKVSSSVVANSDETDSWRPQLHFTPHQNWINDPNGLVYYEGEYHLFYQYNPHGDQWGHMSWGHAVSHDLLKWEELPVAIPERDFMIFSGSAIVDWENRSGLGDGVKPPLLAFFTAHYQESLRQTQCLAYSHDNGRTWKMYDGNPLIDLDMEHHRDPSVFWHEASEAWVMVVAVPRQHKVEIYRSVDLTSWKLSSSFGPAGATGGQWECPTLVEVPDGEATGFTRWVLKIDVDDNLVAGGSGAQYFIGSFDGFAFCTDEDKVVPKARLADHGRDFYAAMAWSNLPNTHLHPVWLGWMSNHQVGKTYPTSPWRGAMTIPRELFVYSTGDVWCLGQRPLSSMSAHTDSRSTIVSSMEINKTIDLDEVPDSTVRDYSLEVEVPGGAIFELALRDGHGAVETLSIIPDKNEITLTDSAGICRTAAYPGLRKVVKVRMIVDASCVEIFIDGGRLTFAQCWFPKDGVKLTTRSLGKSSKVVSFMMA